MHFPSKLSIALQFLLQLFPFPRTDLEGATRAAKVVSTEGGSLQSILSGACTAVMARQSPDQ